MSDLLSHLVATLDDPGFFPKYLVSIGDVFVFLDLPTIAKVCKEVEGVTHWWWTIDADAELFCQGKKCLRSNLPELHEKPHTGEKILYVLEVGDRLCGLRKSTVGSTYDSGHMHVAFGPWVIDDHFRLWKMSERHKVYISDAADEYSAGK